MKGKYIIAFFVIANFIAIASADFEGGFKTESIKMDEAKVEVRKGGEMGGGFKAMSAEDVKIEKIDI